MTFVPGSHTENDARRTHYYFECDRCGWLEDPRAQATQAGSVPDWILNETAPPGWKTIGDRHTCANCWAKILAYADEKRGDDE